MSETDESIICLDRKAAVHIKGPEVEFLAIIIRN